MRTVFDSNPLPWSLLGAASAAAIALLSTMRAPVPRRHLALSVLVASIAGGALAWLVGAALVTPAVGAGVAALGLVAGLLVPATPRVAYWALLALPFSAWYGGVPMAVAAALALGIPSSPLAAIDRRVTAGGLGLMLILGIEAWSLPGASTSLVAGGATAGALALSWILAADGCGRRGSPVSVVAMSVVLAAAVGVLATELRHLAYFDTVAPLWGLAAAMGANELLRAGERWRRAWGSSLTGLASLAIDPALVPLLLGGAALGFGSLYGLEAQLHRGPSRAT